MAPQRVCAHIHVCVLALHGLGMTRKDVLFLRWYLGDTMAEPSPRRRSGPRVSVVNLFLHGTREQSHLKAPLISLAPEARQDPRSRGEERGV